MHVAMLLCLCVIKNRGMLAGAFPTIFECFFSVSLRVDVYRCVCVQLFGAVA